MRRASVAAALAALSILVAGAQPPDYSSYYGLPSTLNYERPDGHRDRGWSYCSLRYKRVRNEAGGNGWMTDWPRAGQNLMERVSVLTTVRVAEQQWVVSAQEDTDALSTCPLVFTSDYGTLGWTDSHEILRLRAYLQKGGTVWLDDSWGPVAWEHWLQRLEELLPGARVEDVPADHPILNSPYKVELAQISNIGFWSGSQGKTSERGDDSLTPSLRAVFDDHGRIMVLMSHNTDLLDPVEHSYRGSPYFARFGAEGYAVVINVLLYSLST